MLRTEATARRGARPRRRSPKRTCVPTFAPINPVTTTSATASLRSAPGMRSAHARASGEVIWRGSTVSLRPGERSSARASTAVPNSPISEPPIAAAATAAARARMSARRSYMPCASERIDGPSSASSASPAPSASPPCRATYALSVPSGQTPHAAPMPNVATSVSGAQMSRGWSHLRHVAGSCVPCRPRRRDGATGARAR